MATAVAIEGEVNHYWNIIKSSNDEVKLELIQRLSESLINKIHKKKEVLTDTNETDAFLKKFKGAWHGNETAEEIITLIKTPVSSKQPPVFD